MSKIIDKANDITLNRTARVRTAISNSGYARQERGSPSFYSLQVDLPLMSKVEYSSIESELLQLNDGLSFVTTTLSKNNKTGITDLLGSFSTATKDQSVWTVNSGPTGIFEQLNITRNNARVFQAFGPIANDDYVDFEGNSQPAGSIPTVGNPLVRTSSYVAIAVGTATEVASDIAKILPQYWILQGISNLDVAYTTDNNYLEITVNDGNDLGIFVENAEVSTWDIDINNENNSDPISIKSQTNAQTIVLEHFKTNSSNELIAGDFIQFNNSTKVYQITENVNSDSKGEGTIKLNTPIIKDVTSTNTIKVGNNVEFKLLLNGRPGVSILPGNDNTNFYTYGTFNFTEVL